MANKTPWHFVIELLIITSGIGILISRFYIYQNNITNYVQYIALIPDISLIIFIMIYILTQVNSKPFYFLLKSYRSIIIILSTIMIIVCDITNAMLLKNDISNWIRTIFDDISYCNTMIMVLLIDTVPNITNMSRILLPFILISVTAYNMYLSYIEWPDQTVFEYKNGRISIEEIQRAAMAQILLYCTTCVFRVFWDVQHSKFTMLTEKIPRKNVLKYKLKIENPKFGVIGFCCSECGLSIYYGLLFFCGFIVMILYVAQYRNPWVLVPFVVAKMFLIFNALHQHFDYNICSKWIFQFRCWLLIISILINIYCTVQKLLWDLYLFEDVFGVIRVLSNLIAYNGAILLCLCRDGMTQTFPLYFSILLCLLLLFVSSWNAFFIQFDIDNVNNQSPAWFIELEKECYYQVNFVMLLILISTYFDKNHIYFVLIVNKRHRADFFCSSRRYSVPTWILNHGLWYENKSHISTNDLIMGQHIPYVYGSTTIKTTTIRTDENDDNFNVTLTSTASDIHPRQNTIELSKSKPLKNNLIEFPDDLK